MDNQTLVKKLEKESKRLAEMAYQIRLGASQDTVKGRVKSMSKRLMSIAGELPNKVRVRSVSAEYEEMKIPPASIIVDDEVEVPPASIIVKKKRVPESGEPPIVTLEAILPPVGVELDAKEFLAAALATPPEPGKTQNGEPVAPPEVLVLTNSQESKVATSVGPIAGPPSALLIRRVAPLPSPASPDEPTVPSGPLPVSKVLDAEASREGG